jgi:hypothetical protein
MRDTHTHTRYNTRIWMWAYRALCGANARSPSTNILHAQGLLSIGRVGELNEAEPLLSFSLTVNNLFVYSVIECIRVCMSYLLVLSDFTVKNLCKYALYERVCGWCNVWMYAYATHIRARVAIRLYTAAWHEQSLNAHIMCTAGNRCSAAGNHLQRFPAAFSGCTSKSWWRIQCFIRHMSNKTLVCEHKGGAVMLHWFDDAIAIAAN